MYATQDELAAYLAIPKASLPSDVDRLIARAGDHIYSLVKRNYDATQSDHVEAMSNATCAQVEFYMNFTESSAISGSNISAFSSGSTSVNYNIDKASQNTPTLSPRARQYLNNVGLLYQGITFSGRPTEQEV